MGPGDHGSPGGPYGPDGHDGLDGLGGLGGPESLVSPELPDSNMINAESAQFTRSSITSIKAQLSSVSMQASCLSLSFVFVC